MTRIDGQATLIEGPVKAGRYELRFAVGDYFRRRGVQPLGRVDTYLDHKTIAAMVTTAK